MLSFPLNSGILVPIALDPFMDFLVKLLRPLDEMPKLFSILVKEDMDGDVDVTVGMPYRGVL